MTAKRFHIVVSGKVQGVGFRYYARDVASSLGLCGWVRNLSGGGVEIEAEGAQSDIDRFIEELREGPALSRVTDVAIQELAVTNNAAGVEFIIRR